MQKQLTDRLAALESRWPQSRDHIFLHYQDEGRYLVDGVLVGAGEWHERLHARAVRIEVRYADLVRPEGQP